MPVFEYTARTATGEETSGTIDAPSREQVVQQLRRDRLMVVRVREQRKRKKRGRVPTRDIVVFTRQFATMVNSGLPLVQALDILAQQTENKGEVARLSRMIATVQPVVLAAATAKVHEHTAPSAFMDRFEHPARIVGFHRPL